MRRLLLAVTFVALPLATAITVAQSSQSGLQLDAMDRRADPCNDFYQFACGGWVANNPIPADRAGWSRFEELQERNNETLHTILESAAAGREPEQKKIGDYYASCMDEPAINKKGTPPLDPLMKKIAALSSITELSPLVAELHTIGVRVFFDFGAEADFKDASVEMAIADQGGMGLPDLSSRR
ncbi:MAG TPA: M13 family metallopeptidase N-terminal domain-containing protein [Vicinamibacterales bacterium]|jgi:endothelin-converting enzyme/putative endopeptidase|nr:M13 family metallopeptidase N-terminal domain-containing protein [Vicinamibacterales bacterium]